MNADVCALLGWQPPGDLCQCRAAGDCRGRAVYGFSQPCGAAGGGDDARTGWNDSLGLAWPGCTHFLRSAFNRMPGNAPLVLGTINLLNQPPENLNR